MNTTRALTTAAALFVVANFARAEQLRIESTFTETGKAALVLPIATVESGKQIEINVAPWSFLVTATRQEGNAVKIETKVARTKSDGATAIISRPTIVTMLGEGATIQVGDKAQGFALRQLVTVAK